MLAGGLGALFCLLFGVSVVLLSSRGGLVLLPIGLVYLVVAGTLVWGGVLALRGLGSLVLQAAAVALVFVALVNLGLALAGGLGLDGFSLFLLVLGAAVVALLRLPAVRSWFAGTP